jgi:hypothetical protein
MTARPRVRGRFRTIITAGLSTTLAVATLAGTVLTAAPAGAATPPAPDAFYHYTGKRPLAKIAPGTVLKSRTLPFHVVGVALGLTATQLLYRSTGQLGQPTVNVTSVIKPVSGFTPSRAISYQSFYDSLNPADSPSYAIAGGVSPGGFISDFELTVFGPLLAQGYSIIVPDTEGEHADFADGPEYGMNTLDSIRAATHSPLTGLTSGTKIGMLGYSGGAIGTDWAAALAPAYAPDVDHQVIGAAEGGVLVDPVHNLHYIDGSQVWAGVMVMAVIGLARTFHVDLRPYLNSKGVSLYDKLQKASITSALGAYPGLTWASLAKPAYQQPERIPVFVRLANFVNLGTATRPAVPMFIGQGANGVLEGTPGDTPGIGAGDGVMVAGDVRTLARDYCQAGVKVQYQQYDLTSHVTTVPLWLPAAIDWLDARFGSQPAQQNCSSIAPGNSLAPIPQP